MTLRTFREAEAFNRRRGVLPTSLTSYELEQLDAGIRRQAFFLSRVTEAGMLQDFQDIVGDLIGGDFAGPGQYLDQPTVRLRLKQLIARSAYQPEPGREGTISDLRTDQRLNLIIETQVKMAQGAGQWQKANSEGARLAFPAQELVRLYQRRVPRGYEEVKGRVVERNPNYWRDRWTAAGGQLYDGRMIALKGDAVWEKISRFGTPWPPFDFNSGMDVKNVGRREAVALGLIEPNERVPDPRSQYEYGSEDTLKASGNYDAAIQARLTEALKGGLGQSFAVRDGVLEAV